MKAALVETILVLLTLLNYSTTLEGSDEVCHYKYVRQPSSETTCNPWPLLSADSVLPLHCFIRAPQNDHLPNVMWYKQSDNDTVKVYPGGHNPKYTNPVWSGDVASFKFVNFSLIIHNVTNSDVGCYHCEINVTAGDDCEFDIRPSNQYCLLDEDEYSNTTNCVSVPVNEDVVCAVNKTHRLCSTTAVSVTVQPTSLELGVVISTSVALKQQQTSKAQSSSSISEQIETTVLPHSNPPATTTNPPPQSPSVNSLATSSLDHSAVIAKNSHAPKVTTVASIRSTRPPSSQQELRIGLYVGVGVCCLLLVVILILLAAVAVLCKAPGVKKPQRDSIAAASTSTEPLNSTVWTRPSPTLTTSLINEGSLHLHTGTPSLPTGSTKVARRVLRHIAPGRSGSLPRPLPSHMTEEHDTSRGVHVHHRLSLTNQLQSSNETAQVTTPPRSGSPDTHYYHVLEQPRYYNYNWLASNAEGREVLLQNWKEGDTETTTGQNSCESTEVKGHGAQPLMEENDDECYHWRVVPPSGRDGGSPRRQGRQLYTRLDCSKLEPRREYAQVSIKSSVSAESLEQEN